MRTLAERGTLVRDWFATRLVPERAIAALGSGEVKLSVRRNAVSEGQLRGVLWDYTQAKDAGVKDPLAFVGEQWGLARSTVHLYVKQARGLEQRRD